MNRPPVAWSRTVAALASTAGCRNVADSTPCPTHLPGTRWMRAAIVVSASNDAPCRSCDTSVRWSFIQTESKMLVFADPGPGAVERRPVDRLG